MDRPGFLKLLAREFYPMLRAEGFRGSGSTLRRIDDPVIHVFNVQGSTSADRCYLNLGAHLSFLPAEGGGVLVPASFHEYHCIFRDLIEPPTGPADGWAYGRTPEETSLIIEFLVSEWRTQGLPFFRRYASYPESFLSLLTEVDPDRIHARDALHYARIALHLGQADRAMTFARAGLATAPEQATYLRADLLGVLKALGAE